MASSPTSAHSPLVLPVEPARHAPANLQLAGMVSARFRAGMLPLAIGTAVTVALAAPLADVVLEHHDLARRAQLHASQLAGRLEALDQTEGAVQRGDAPRLAAIVALVQEDRDAEEVTRVEIWAPGPHLLYRSVAPTATVWPTVWNEAPLRLSNGGGSVRIAVAEPEWLSRDLGLLAAFGLLGLLLGFTLYYFPLRLFREEDLVRLFARRSINAAEEERLRLSRDLHDGVGQTLGAAAIAVARLSARLGRGPETEEAARLLDGALDELRRVSRGLRPPSLDDLGLSAAVTALAVEAQSQGLRATLKIEQLPRFDREVELTCFRIAQEALANVLRHARASWMQVRLSYRDGMLCLQVDDDGCGFTQSSGLGAASGGGLGLVGARERAAQLAGSLSVESGPATGTHLTALVPCAPLPPGA